MDLESPIPDTLLCPQVNRSTTASQLLAAFSPQPQLKLSPSKASIPAQTIPIAMESKRTSRHKEHVSYEISSDSDNLDTSSALDSTFSTPQKPARHHVSIVDLDDESEEIEPPKTPPARVSAAGHLLRQYRDLHLSLRAQENGDKPIIKKRRLNKSFSKSKWSLKPSAPEAPLKTARNGIREKIATETATKRNNFFVAKKEFFLPLLPEGNHIQRVAAQRGQSETLEKDLSIPYEVLERQPTGYALVVDDRESS